MAVSEDGSWIAGPDSSQALDLRIKERRGDHDPPRNRRVLIVDAEPSVRQTLTSIFAASEYDVEAVPDGLGAIARLQDGSLRPRHYGPPTAGGRRHSARPRSEASLARNQGRHITAHPSQSSAIEAVNIGVDGYLTKPFRPMDVLLATARAFEADSAVAAAEPTSTVTADTRSC